MVYGGAGCVVVADVAVAVVVANGAQEYLPIFRSDAAHGKDFPQQNWLYLARARAASLGLRGSISFVEASNLSITRRSSSRFLQGGPEKAQAWAGNFRLRQCSEGSREKNVRRKGALGGTCTCRLHEGALLEALALLPFLFALPVDAIFPWIRPTLRLLLCIMGAQNKKKRCGQKGRRMEKEKTGREREADREREGHMNLNSIAICASPPPTRAPSFGASLLAS